MSTTCAYCDEPLESSPYGRPDFINFVRDGACEKRAVHHECQFRQIVGGINHQLGRCTCCGGAEPPDPEGLTRHEAALAATNYWYSLGKRATP